MHFSVLDTVSHILILQVQKWDRRPIAILPAEVQNAGSEGGGHPNFWPATSGLSDCCSPTNFPYFQIGVPQTVIQSQ